MSPDRSLRTAYLGQFDHDRAERIAAALEQAGIAWSYKQFGRITQLFFLGEWGVRLFVDGERIEDARAIVERTTLEGDAG